MSDSIEEISSKRKINDYYRVYQEIEEYLDEVENLEIDEIILSVCAKDREIQFGRKVAHLNSRQLLQNAQNNTSNQKASIFRETKGLCLETAGVISHVAAVGFGPGFTAIGQAFTTSASYTDKVARSREEVLGHSYQRMRDIIGDHSQGMQSAEKEYEQNANMIDRMNQNDRRQAELVAGN